VDSGALSGVADVLAGESSAEDVNGWQVVGTALSDVGESLRSWKVFCQHAATVGVNFNLPSSSNSRSLKAKVKPSYASKQGTVSQHFFISPAPSQPSALARSSGSPGPGRHS
jgi:hypothetical protein